MKLEQRIVVLLSYLLLIQSGLYAQHFIIAEPPGWESGSSRNSYPTYYINESFFFFREGSEEKPLAEHISNPENNEIPSKYTFLQGWTGTGVSQAGGVCALHSGKGGGRLETPAKEMPGELCVTVKIKIMNKAKIPDEGIELSVHINKGTPGNSISLHTQSFLFTDYEWKECVFIYNNKASDKIFISVGDPDIPLLIDDLKVKSERTPLLSFTCLLVNSFTKHIY